MATANVYMEYFLIIMRFKVVNKIPLLISGGYSNVTFRTYPFISR